MATRTNASRWKVIRAELAAMDRAGLIALLQELHAVSKDNQAFLNARFAPGDDELEPYKATITRWINPSDPRKPMSVAKARKAIGDYKNALGRPEGLAESSVYFCEQGFNVLARCGMEDAAFCDGLVRMFEQALMHVLALPAERQPSLVARLDRVRRLGRDVGWGVAEDFDDDWITAGQRVGA